MKELEILKEKELTIKSVELVDIINQFRRIESEENFKELRHDNFMIKIKREEEALENAKISALNFKVAEYIDEQGKQRKCFELNRNGMLQMLNSESAVVRYKTIEYINKLEASLGIQNKDIEIENLKNMVNNLTKYVQLPQQKKRRYTDYIKMRLGVNASKENVNKIKQRVFLVLGVQKWQDIESEQFDRIVNLIDESIKVLSGDLSKQIALFS